MVDRATANLPSRAFDVTAAFYAKLGFSLIHRSDDWMVLARGAATLEFFPHPDLMPDESWFSACLRLDDAAAMVTIAKYAGIPETTFGFPRIHSSMSSDGIVEGAIVDADGSLLRLIRN